MRVRLPRRILVPGCVTLLLIGGAAHGSAQADANSGCDPLLAATHLNSAPAAVDDAAWVRPGAAVRIDVLDNDVDFDDDELFIEAVTAPTSGSTSIEGQVVAFVADEGEGPASFQYRVTDGACGTDLATVRVTVSRNEEPAGLAEPSNPVTSVPAYAG